MWRWTRRIGLCLSTALCLLLILLWITSYRWGFVTSFPAGQSAVQSMTVEGRTRVVLYQGILLPTGQPFAGAAWPGEVRLVPLAEQSESNRAVMRRAPTWLWRTSRMGGGMVVREVSFPLWLPALLAATPSVVALLVRERRRRRRSEAEPCPSCRYDRRHTPAGPCPECGHPSKVSRA